MALKKNWKMSQEKVKSYTAETGNWKKKHFDRHKNNTARGVGYFTEKKINKWKICTPPPIAECPFKNASLSYVLSKKRKSSSYLSRVFRV